MRGAGHGPHPVRDAGGGPKEWDMERLRNGMWGSPKEWDVEGAPRNGISELSAACYLLFTCVFCRYLLFTCVFCRRYRCWNRLRVFSLPLIVSWKCNGDSGLAFGRGTFFPCPGPRLSRSRTRTADPHSLSCLVGALEVFSSTLGAHRVRASIPA